MEKSIKSLKSRMQLRSKNPYEKKERTSRKRKTWGDTNSKKIRAVFGVRKRSRSRSSSDKTLMGLKQRMKDRLISRFKATLDLHNKLHPDNMIPYEIKKKDHGAYLMMRG